MIYMGFDPGASSALVALEGVSGSLPVVRGAWSIWGSPDIRWQRFMGAFDEVKRIVGPQHPDERSRIGIELPAGGGAGGGRKMHGWQLSIGRHIGHAELMSKSCGFDIRLIKANVWTQLVGVRYGKRAEGLHRIDEAGARVQGLGLYLGELATTKAGRERQVCLAEAALIALSQIN